jgi:hypothetical protein
MYDFDLGDLDELGWDQFVETSWESVFVGYRSATGIRTIGRRWRDLLQGGLGCSEEVADALVREQVIFRQDRDLMKVRDPEQLLAAMDQVLSDMGDTLADLPEIRPADRPELLAAHARLREFLREQSGETGG